MKGGKGVEIRVERKNGSVRYGGREKKGRVKVGENREREGNGAMDLFFFIFFSPCDYVE
jgi:hypothetical protein